MPPEKPRRPDPDDNPPLPEDKKKKPGCNIPYSYNPTDAPDSLPSIGERLYLEAVFGGSAALSKWGRNIGFGRFGRLNYLTKAHVTRDLKYLRLGDPVSNSVATFERVGDSHEYAPVESPGYAGGTRVRLTEFVGGVPQTMTVAYPTGSRIVLEFETTTVYQELDGFVFRVVERRTRQGHATTFSYEGDRLVITDASGHEYICLLESDLIREINFTVDGETRRWTYTGLDTEIVETNLQTGKTITSAMAYENAVSGIAIVGADGTGDRHTFHPSYWRQNRRMRYIKRTLPTSETAKFTEGEASWTYDVRGLIERVDQLGNTETFGRNNMGQMTRKTDALGNVWLRDYDENGNFLSSEDPDGSRTECDYDAAGNLTAKRVLVAPGEWAEYAYSYDAHGCLTSVVNPDGGETRYILDANCLLAYRLEKVDTGRWSAVAYDYNTNGQVTGKSLPYWVANPTRPEVGRPANALTIAYDKWGNQISRTGALGNVTSYEYDAGNRLVATVDPLGHRTGYTYNGVGYKVAQTDCQGNTTRWTYDRNWNVTQVRGSSSCGSCGADASDRPGDYVWGDDRLLKSYTDLAGRKTTYAYDAARRKISEADALGNATLYAYDEAGRLASTTDPIGNATTFAYDAVGRLVSRTDALGNTSRIEYDLAGRMTAILDAAGGETRFEYDAMGRQLATLVKVDDDTWRESRSLYNLRGDLVETAEAPGTPDVVVTRYEYDAAGRVLRTIVDPDGLAILTENSYDVAGNLIRAVDPNSYAAVFEYGAGGNLVRSLSPEGRETVYEYDEAGRRVMTRLDPDGIDQFQAVVYDAASNVLEVSNGVSAVAYTYDAAGRPVAATRTSADRATVLATSRKYDAAGRVIETVDEIGNITRYAYDAAGRLVSTTDPKGAVTAFHYDAAGRQTRVVPPLGAPRLYRYNLAGDLVETSGGPEGPKLYFYDVHGRQIEVFDANLRSRKTVYDKAGRVIRLENEMGQPVHYAYDAAGNRVMLTDANGNVSTWTYDRDGRQLSLTYPSVAGQPENVERYAYDAAGRLSCKTTPNGDDIRFFYDAAGNVQAVYHGAAVADVASIPASNLIAKYERDGAGEVMKEECPVTAMLYQYDEFGRLIEAKDRALNKAVRYAYNARSLRSSMQVVDYDAGASGDVSMTVAYGYDANGRLASVKKDDDPAALYLYDAAGRRTSLALPNGVTTAYTYDDADRLLTLTTSKDTTVYASFAYQMDPTGNRTGITYADGSRYVYEFDNAYRLTRDQRLAANNSVLYDERYTYDPLGNRLTKVRAGWEPVNVNYTYNAKNQLVETTGTENKVWAYDQNGNPVRTVAGIETEDFAYDVLNRLTRYEGPAGAEETQYRGAAWHRWSVDAMATGAAVASRTVFLYNGDDVVGDYAGLDAVLSMLYVTPNLDENLSVCVFNESEAGNY